MKLIMLFFLLLLINFNVFAQPDADVKIIAYFSGNISQLDSIQVNKLTHLIFCFGHLKGTSYSIDNAADTAVIKKMVTLKQKNPALKILLSLGGWGGCENCSDAFSTKKGIQEFANSVKHINDYLKTDGIDLDWEYPTIRLDNDIDKEPVHKTSPADRENFTRLVKELRAVLGADATISFAAGGFQTYLEKSIDWKAVMPNVNFVNLMTYDLLNGYAKKTGHHTPLYSTSQQKESTDNAVRYLLKIGVDAKKIIIGAAFYARVWQSVPAENNGLYQSGKFLQAVNFRQISTTLSESRGFKYFWDGEAKAPYLYNIEEKKFATYDDESSVHLKTRYVIDKHLGGIMFWEIGSDDVEGGLLNVIYKAVIQPETRTGKYPPY